MPETDLFLTLADIKWQIDELKDLISHIEKYSPELISKSFSNLPENHYSEALLDDYCINLKDYQALVCAGLLDIVNRVTSELKSQIDLLHNLELSAEQIKMTIISLSYLTPKEVLAIYTLFNQKSIPNLDAPSPIFLLSKENGELSLNPILAHTLTPELIDFLKYIINGRLQNKFLNIPESYQNYSSNMNLTNMNLT